MQHSISLLWPYGKKEGNTGKVLISQTAANDIGIISAFKRYSGNCSSRYNLGWNMLERYITDDCKTIAYRLDIVEDLLNNPELCSRLEQCIEKFAGDSAIIGTSNSLLYIGHMQYEVGKIKVYADTISELDACLNTEGANLASKGLAALREFISGICSPEAFQNLKRNLYLIDNIYAKPVSIDIGVNFNDLFSLESIVLASINNFRYDPPVTILERIMYKCGIRSMFNGLCLLQFTKRKGNPRLERSLLKYLKQDEFTRRIYESSRKRDKGSIIVSFYDVARFTLRHREYEGKDYEKMMNAELYSTCNKFFNQISDEISSGMRNKLNLLNSICEELKVLIAYVKFINELRSFGIRMCKPESMPAVNKSCMIKDICNLNLVYGIHERYKNSNISAVITYNDVCFEEGKPMIITGPNQGGKTTYIQAVAQAQVLFQLGLYVPGSEAEISPVDAIYTHFPVEEDKTLYKGRLGEECMRMADIFKKATAGSLIIINEAFSSTSGGEGPEIGRNVINGLKTLGAHSLYATHFHSLADEPGAVSLVAGADIRYDEKGDEHIKLTHKIRRMPSAGKSYAKNTAKRYGIDLNSIVNTRTENTAVDNL